MFLIAWVCLIAAIVWLIGNAKQPWIARIYQRKRDTIRVLSFGASTLIAFGSTLGLTMTVRSETVESGMSSFAPWFAFGAGLIGAVIYSVGLIIWRGRRASAIRFVGWILMAIAGAVPSTASLALPFIAFLAIAIGTVPSDTSAQKSGRAEGLLGI